MDPMDLLTGAFSYDSGAFDPVRNAQQQREEEEQREEKREDNPSSSSSSSCSSTSSDDEPEQDMDFPTTQVLPEPMDEEMEEVEVEKPPMSPAVVRSPAKPRNSPAKTLTSPVKPRASPVKVRSSPAKVRSSPVKMRSPLKARSPAKPRSSPVKARSPTKPRSSPVKAGKPPVAPAPIIERLQQAEKKKEKAEEKEEDDDTPDEFRAKGAEGKFMKVFPAIAKLVEAGGWMIAQGNNTLFCAMPGVQFFNFKPNINVFDSKVKACWKFIQMAGERQEDAEDKELWDMLWPIAEKQFKWFTMMCGPEMWFVKPDTKFEDFRPNETVFQSKKRAVLKCLAVEVGDIELGESAEGHQVLAFAPREVRATPAPAPKKAKTALFKTPSPAVKRTTPTSTSSTRYVTPAKRVSPASAASGAKRRLASSKLSSKSVASRKKVKGGKAGAKRTATKKKKRKNVSDAASDVSKGDEFNFMPPEFKCTFGIVYSKLQDEGWYHKIGQFGYDYFAPTYTEATKEVDINYFQSEAAFENHLKESGTWARIEDELRAEHEAAVDQEREKALDRHHQRLEQQATRKRNLTLYGAPTTYQDLAAPVAPRPKKAKKKVAAPKRVASTPPASQSLYQAEVEAAKAAEESTRSSEVSEIKMGQMVKRLIQRGWYYRPGRFEYDYFKPSANPKTAVAGEDRFESLAALEVYLKTSGIWEQIAQELEYEELSKHDARATLSEESPERPVKRSKLGSPPPASAQSPNKPSSGGVHKEDVKAITNDIWANSHEFDFNE
jgi:hypothetical protein